MPLFHAKDCTFAIGDGATPTEHFTTIGSVRLIQCDIENAILPDTAIRTHGWQTLFAPGGTASVRIVLEGAYSDSTAEDALVNAAFNGGITNYRLSYANNDTLSLPAVVARYQRGGEVGELEGYSITLESAGEVVFGG